jgi:hypothetical protein
MEQPIQALAAIKTGFDSRGAARRIVRALASAVRAVGDVT